MTTDDYVLHISESAGCVLLQKKEASMLCVCVSAVVAGYPVKHRCHLFPYCLIFASINYMVDIEQRPAERGTESQADL